MNLFRFCLLVMIIVNFAILSITLQMTTNINENINIWASQINNEFKSAVSVDCVIFGYEDQVLKVLVSKCDMPPYTDQKSLLGDIVHPDETTEEAALRVLKSKTGFDDVYLEQVKVFSTVNRHPLGRVITVAFYSLIEIDESHRAHIEADKQPIEWINVESLNEMAFDHFEITQACLESLRKKLREQPVGFSLLPDKFTLFEIQNLYEAILGEKLDKRNFRRKLLALNILTDRGLIEEVVSHRPARLYSFDLESYNRKRLKGFVFDL